MKPFNALQEEIKKNGFIWMKGCTQDYFEKVTQSLGKIILITDVKVNPQSKSLVTSESGLDFHTDHHQANLIAWYCIEQTDAGGESILHDANQIFDRMSKDEQNELKKVRLLEHKVFEGDEQTWPFVVEDNRRRWFYYSFWLVEEGISSKGKAAIMVFQKQTNEMPHIRLKLMPTDILIVDNNRMLHGRTAIEGNKKRFLKRYWIKTNF